MVGIPTVKSFCGCCDLKVACVAIASFRLVISIIVFITLICYLLLFGFVVNEIEEGDLEGHHEEFRIIAILILIWFIILIPIVMVNILFSYWFVRGVTSTDPTKMKYYVYMEAVNVIMLALPFVFRVDLSYFVAAAFECYIAICSYSLYKEFLNSPHQDAENTVIKFENNPAPPPQYSSYENDLNVQKTGAYPQLNP